MNLEEINKYLTEQMREDWNAWDSFESECKPLYAPNFFTPDGFFKLWNWAMEQGWWEEFCSKKMIPKGHCMFADLYLIINPERFAVAIYEFLKQREVKDEPS